MKYYLSYKFDDYDILRENIDAFIQEDSKDEIFLFRPEQSPKTDSMKNDEDWKPKAAEKIKKTDCLIYIQCKGKVYNDEEKFQNINYELGQAKENGVPILVAQITPGKDKKLNSNTIEEETTPNLIYQLNYLDKMQIKYKTICELDGELIRKKIFNIQNSLFHDDNNLEKQVKMDNHLLFEEYRTMLETSEKMIDRRQGTNNFYITLCTAMVTAISSLFASNLNGKVILHVALGSCLVLAFLCNNWEKTLMSYGKSNEAKYEVLNAIEARLPASIFLSEWEYGKLNRYESYSKREIKIPKFFKFLFLAGAAASAITLIVMLIKHIVF